ncbi:MAG: four helix bundle protein [Deltaproteobacteria bacterium]|nr:four helix bundle protein [Deltaproteobacteria bacterium]
MKRLKNYKELKVWQKPYELCLHIYKVTKRFPKDEMYGLASQIRRSAVSIPSNIAEGYGRKTLESLNPGPLGSFLPTNWEKNQKKKLGY